MREALPLHIGEEPPPRLRRPWSNDLTIKAFMQSGSDSARVEHGERDPGCLRNCLAQRIRKLGLEGQVVAIERKYKVYLVRKAAYEEGLGR